MSIISGLTWAQAPRDSTVSSLGLLGPFTEERGEEGEGRKGGEEMGGEKGGKEKGGRKGRRERGRPERGKYC